VVREAAIGLARSVTVRAVNCFAERSTPTTVPISPVTRREARGWIKGQPKRAQRWLKQHDFSGAEAEVVLIPSGDGKLDRVALGLGDGGDMWCFAAAAEAVPAGRYRIDGAEPLAGAAALGWAMAAYRFDLYRDRDEPPMLVWPDSVDRAAIASAAEAVWLGRDLITTPAGDLGPAELADAVKAAGKARGARVSVIAGDKLLDKGYPAIHAVGRAAAKGREPRLIDLRWGDPDAVKLTLVGKGVVFDTGGLDIKTAAGMRLMKKDMGGAASVLALASMIMDAGLGVSLRLLIPAVENAISGGAYRPGDVLQTRRGLTVEVGNTDAEGRLVLCDALAEAASEEPDLIVDMATLTGAARVALGTEVPILFATEQEVADEILAAGRDPQTPDELWQLPLHRPYRRFLESDIADISNIASVSFGGAITAALFLREFVGDTSWVHIDTMGYNDKKRPGRPIGGEILGARALFAAFERWYPAA
jgi:leucyl aminopeptidase